MHLNDETIQHNVETTLKALSLSEFNVDADNLDVNITKINSEITFNILFPIVNTKDPKTNLSAKITEKYPDIDLDQARLVCDGTYDIDTTIISTKCIMMNENFSRFKKYLTKEDQLQFEILENKVVSAIKNTLDTSQPQSVSKFKEILPNLSNLLK